MTELDPDDVDNIKAVKTVLSTRILFSEFEEVLASEQIVITGIAISNNFSKLVSETPLNISHA